MEGGLSPYRFQGVRSLQCCHLEWFSHSGPQAGSGVRCEDQTMTYCWESPIPPSRCHSSCAERRPAGPARGWWWRRSLADGYARKQRDNKMKSSTHGKQFSTPLFLCLMLPWRQSAGCMVAVTAQNSTI